MSPLRFELATGSELLEQASQLNYRTFVEEIPQHRPNAERRLVDPYLDRSALYVCLDAERVVGMAAISGTRPFSLDRKLPDLESHLPAGEWSLCEIRLLTIEKAYRRRKDALAGLLRLLYQHVCGAGYDLCVISAALSQLALYRRIGFRPFGPALGTAQAPYQGMYLTLERASRSVGQLPPAELEGRAR